MYLLAFVVVSSDIDIDVPVAAVVCVLPSGKYMPDVPTLFSRYKFPLSAVLPNIAKALFVKPVVVAVPIPTLPLMVAPFEIPTPPATVSAPEVDVVAELKAAKVEVLICYLPVGSEEAAKFYAQCAIDAGCAFVNALPVFIASDKEWADKFTKAGLPIVGDDIKSQVGATITHRIMAKLFQDRGVHLDRT